MASCHIRGRALDDGAKRYDVRFRRGGRYVPMEHAGTFRTVRDARARQTLVMGWLAAGLDPLVELRRLEHRGRLLAEVAADWLASKRSVTERTREEYGRLADVIVARFRGRAEDISPDDVRKWVGDLSETMKPATVTRAVRTLRAILDHADLPRNPARHRSVELPRVPRRTLEPPDGGDVLAVVAALPERYRLSVVTMEQCGLRVSEALSLVPADVEPLRLLIRAEHSKSGRPRWVPCPPWLVGYVAEEVKGRTKLSRQVVHNALKRACKDAGVRPFGPHMLRHRRATLWHQQGVVAVELAARLGHAKPSMSLDVYSHVPRLCEAPAQRLAALLR